MTPLTSHVYGSSEVWDEVWDGAETQYSERLSTQNQVFEHIKISALVKIFPKKEFKMLEVGCGTAFVSLYFAKRRGKVYCLDSNKKILKVAKRNFKSEGANGKFVLGDTQKLPFRNNTFDVVTSFGLLEHFKDPSQPIKEMVRVTKPGGVVFADIVPNRFSCQTIGNYFNLAASMLYWSLKGKPLFGWQKGMKNLRPLYYENSIGWVEYKKILASAGVELVKVRGNRPFPRLTLPRILDRAYASLIKLFMPFWRWFDSSGGSLSRFWGAGWWFWGVKGV